mmetsp:Transcript_13115/g.30541  ORF Transcript_13115/g.30541 Transcript_13115/m.30541 type:complete len:224 (+) Transcript_13115:332-1003(+)
MDMVLYTRLLNEIVWMLWIGSSIPFLVVWRANQNNHHHNSVVGAPMRMVAVHRILPGWRVTRNWQNDWYGTRFPSRCDSANHFHRGSTDQPTRSFRRALLRSGNRGEASAESNKHSTQRNPPVKMGECTRENETPVQAGCPKKQRALTSIQRKSCEIRIRKRFWPMPLCFPAKRERNPQKDCQQQQHQQPTSWQYMHPWQDVLPASSTSASSTSTSTSTTDNC